MMSDTPMTDLYVGDPLRLSFALSWSGLYHGYIPPSPRPICGTVTTYRDGLRVSCELGIPSGCQPCKLCLAVLRRTNEEAANANRTEG